MSDKSGPMTRESAKAILTPPLFALWWLKVRLVDPARLRPDPSTLNDWSGPMTRESAKAILVPPLYALWWLWVRVLNPARLQSDLPRSQA